MVDAAVASAADAPIGGERRAGRTPAVEISGLRYWYPESAAPVLDGIDLTVIEGEMVIVIGSSGGGKSTLMLALNGIVPKQTGGRLAGSVRVAGLDPLEHELAEMATKVGLVFQDPDSQLAAIFVRDEVAFGLQNLLVDRPTIERQVAEALTFVGLAGLAERDVFSLSGGEKQRLAIAAVLAMRPAVMVLDEPTANLDPTGAVEVARLVTKLRDGGQTLIIVEHQINDLAALADRLVVLDAGRVRFEGPPRDVLRDHGPEIQDELGLWIPQASAFALAIRPAAGRVSPFPLSSDEVPLIAEVEAPPAVRERRAEEPAAGPTVVLAEHVAYRYGSGNEALVDVSCTIRASEVVALLGQNGSGKTTFASLLVGLRKPTGGVLDVCGQPVRSAGVGILARDVSYVFQYPEHQFVAERVDEDVAYGLRRRDVPDAEVERRVTEMLERFGLAEFRERHPFKLSVGQKRRLSVADMLVTKPRLLILDEPTAGQDRRSTQALVDLLDDLRARTGLAVIVITHDMTLVAQWCARAVVLSGGRSIFDGTTQELFDDVGAGRLAAAVRVPDQWHIARRLWPVFSTGVPLRTPAELGALVRRVA